MSIATVDAVYTTPLFRRTGVIYAHIYVTSHLPGPKWRLKLLPVAVSTAFFDSLYPVSYEKVDSSRLAVRHRPLSPSVLLL